MQQSWVKIKLIVMNGKYRNILPVYHNKLYYLNKFEVRHLHSFNIYINKCFLQKEVNTQNSWTFELGTQEGINVPIWNVVGFQQRDRQGSQNLNNDTFHRSAVTSAQCVIGTEKYPVSAILLNYDDDNFRQGYGQIKDVFRALTKDDILKPCLSGNHFRSSNNGNDIDYNLNVSDIRYQKNLESAQPIKVDFEFSENILAGVYGYALV